jgi:hypothetical protein
VISELDILQRRKVIVENWEWACGVPEHSEVQESDPRYITVTGGLDPGSFGVHPDPVSSCPFPAHWGLLQAGCRQDWIDHPAAPRGWRGDQGVVGRLVYRGPGSNALAHRWEPGTDVQGGDIVVISAGTWGSWRSVHVVCVIDVHSDGQWSTCQYGQPGGALKLCQLDGGLLRTVRADGTLTAGRYLRSWLSLEAVVRDADELGLLVDPALPLGP